ncbi:MAG: hypothetical protein GEU28_14325, partial [Dehalococcoidia bacterium]|nr:hypothetical protein [Dehalococcoidia bacterium]
MTIFGVPWSELTLEGVASYLDDAEEEPLLWEAKGIQLQAHAVRKEVGAFGNSHDGGYLILGAEQGETWELTGCEFPAEPRVWVSQTIHDGIRPVPPFDVHAFPEKDGHVAVVRVQSTPVPPCIVRGTVYERIPGAAIPVKAPERLSELFQRGDLARAGAESGARHGARRLMINGVGRGSLFGGSDNGRKVQAAVALAPTGMQPDISSRLFTRPFEEALSQAAQALHGGPRLPSAAPPEISWSQDTLAVDLDIADVARTHWRVQAGWDGVVGIYYLIELTEVFIESLIEHVVGAAWDAGIGLLRQLGATGPMFVMVIAAGGPFPANVPTNTSLEDRFLELGRGPVALDDNPAAHLQH